MNCSASTCAARWKRHEFKITTLCFQVPSYGAHLIMTEPLFNLASIRSSTVEAVFESFGFESFYSAPAPQFAVHKWAADNPDDVVAQSLSGIVLDAGYSFTHAVPIFDGNIQLDAVRRIRLGGKLLTNLIKEWVRSRCVSHRPRYPSMMSCEADRLHIRFCFSLQNESRGSRLRSRASRM
jgi:actin-related protein 6